MKRFLVCGVAASFVAMAGAEAQAGAASECASVTVQTQDACQKAVDVFKFMMPQLGVMMTGGNATLGQGGTLGGFGHFLISARANVMHGSVPQVDAVTPSISGAQSTDYEVKSQILALPQVDASIGIFKGIPLGVTNVGGLDLLVSAAYLPSISSGSLDIAVPHSSLKFGLGGRLGIIQESVIFPGVSVTYLRRSLPTADLTATSGSDSLHINNLNVTTDAWRLVANKSLLLFGLSAGIGRDTYSAGTLIKAYVSEGLFTGDDSVSVHKSMSRTNAFFDLSANLPFLKIVGEIGRASGGTLDTYNTFSGHKADDAITYGSVGLRFGF